MPIKSLKKLPERALKMWESVYKTAKKKFSEERAAKIAWTIVRKNFKSVRKGKKSVAVTQPTFDATSSDTFIDVLLGFPTVDEHGEFLTESFWQNRPFGVIKGDMEHYYADKAAGVYSDIDDTWEGFVPVIQKFWTEDDNKLMGRVELPVSHPQTPTFINDWKSGEYGVSIEYVAPEEAVEFQWIDGELIETITEGQITGFSFTKNPAIDTKPKNGNEIREIEETEQSNNSD